MEVANVELDREDGHLRADVGCVLGGREDFQESTSIEVYRSAGLLTWLTVIVTGRVLSCRRRRGSHLLAYNKASASQVQERRPQ